MQFLFKKEENANIKGVMYKFLQVLIPFHIKQFSQILPKENF